MRDAAFYVDQMFHIDWSERVVLIPRIPLKIPSERQKNDRPCDKFCLLGVGFFLKQCPPLSIQIAGVPLGRTWMSSNCQGAKLQKMPGFINPAAVEIHKTMYIGYIHPWSLTWKLKISHWKRRFLLETIIFRFHVKLWGCIYLIYHINWCMTSSQKLKDLNDIKISSFLPCETNKLTSVAL